MTTPGQQLTPGDDQNPPVFGVPEGAYVGDAGASNAITDLNNLNEAEAKRRMQAPINPSFTAQRDGVWGTVDDFIAMLLGTYGGTSQPFIDGQLALNHRLDLLTDVSGYCATYQDRNWRSDGNTRRVPFSAKVGPNKNAHPGDGGIYLDAPGTWRVDAVVTTQAEVGTAAQGRFIISVRDQNEAIYSEAWYDVLLGTSDRSWAWSTTVVVEEPNYHVRVYFGHNGSPLTGRRLLGGTHRSRLSVNRWDIDTGDFVVDTDVPDGGDL